MSWKQTVTIAQTIKGHSRRLSPPAFRYQLTELARKAGKRVVLPEGDEPRVAMLPYSTATSGVGSDVEKVREATRLAQEKRPDLMIDGALVDDIVYTIALTAIQSSQQQ